MNNNKVLVTKQNERNWRRFKSTIIFIGTLTDSRLRKRAIYIKMYFYEVCVFYKTLSFQIRQKFVINTYF